jgi:DNA-binding FadR family transcriptional regulator
LAEIESNLRTGAWTLGQRLPSERALAEQMGVSRPSVREAVRVLEAMGIVRTAVGSGPDAGATIVDRPAAGLGAAVRLHIASGTLPMSDVVATRAPLEVWATGQAAAQSAGEMADGEDITRIKAILDDDETLPLSPSQFTAHDARFHMAIVRLAGNQLTEAILGGLRSAIGGYIERGAERLADWPETRGRLFEEHRAILAAVEAGDAALARELAHHHIWAFFEAAGLASEN